MIVVIFKCRSEDFVKKGRFRAVLRDTGNVCCRREEDV